MDTRVEDVRTGLQDEIAVLRGDVAGIAAGLSAGAPAPGGTEPPAPPDAGEQAAASEATETSPDATDTDPDATDTGSDAQSEPPDDPDASAVTPAPPGE